jgi:hypothetical protein
MRDPKACDLIEFLHLHLLYELWNGLDSTGIEVNTEVSKIDI